MDGETILAVDDLPENLMTLKLGLRKFNFDFHTARSGDIALEMLATLKPDLILMDIQMPGKDGFETAQIIKQMPGLEDVPIIFLSALRDLQNIVRCFESGGVDYISKPFRNQELVARIGTHLKIRRLQQNLETERSKMHTILSNILPESYVNKLKEGQRPQTEIFKDAVLIFTDFKNFTGISRDLGPETSINHLNRIFFAFDEIISHFGLERVKTLGDGYFAVAGINTNGLDASIRSVSAMLKMQEFIHFYNIKYPEIDWKLRIGAHVGEVIAGIVGYQKIAFDVWGSPVNIASRLQNVADTDGIVLSDEMYTMVKESVVIERSESRPLHNLGDHTLHFIYDLSDGCPETIRSSFENLKVESLYYTYSEDTDIIKKLFPTPSKSD